MTHSLGFVNVKGQSIRYDMFVLKLFKVMSHEKMVSHALRGLASEVGELTDTFKKHLDYEQELDMTNVLEELGDMRFYLQALMNIYGLDEQTVLQLNADKLSVRYHNLLYSDLAAKLRKDKE
jgi:NTP pyrophosphatase (non-canonical NTP hydrolase)